MKKISIIIYMILIMCVLSSCNIADGDMAERISSPDNNTPPIEGKWVIEDTLKGSYLNINQEDDLLIGREGLFHKDGVVIGDSFTTKPSYKIKNVNSTDYLLYKYKSSPKSLGIEDKTIEVITILNDNTYFYEFIKVDDDTLLIYIDDTFYSMKRTLEEVNIEEIDRYINVEKSMLRTFGAVEDENLQTGILIGIKVPSFDEINQVPTWEYKTIWISSQNNTLAGVYELDELLMPRKNGFWIIDNKRDVSNEYIRDDLTAIPQFRVVEEEVVDDNSSTLFARKENTINISNENVIERSFPSILKNILFIGNDYISVENIDLDRNGRKTLQMYAIDNLDEKKPIKLTDLIGVNGKEIFAEGVRSVLSVDPTNVPNEENVGLIRRNGYWIMKGRINYKQNNEEFYKDFNIKAIPPKEMVSYDDLTIPWDAIRLLIPDVVDVFSSPNNEFLVVLTGSQLVVYYLMDGEIVNSPVAKIKLPYDASIIMSEWAVGRYAKIWQDEVIDNGGISLKY